MTGYRRSGCAVLAVLALVASACASPSAARAPAGASRLTTIEPSPERDSTVRESDVREIQIIASHGGPHGPMWQATIHWSGDAMVGHTESLSGEPQETHLHLDRSQLHAITQSLIAERFFALPEHLHGHYIEMHGSEYLVAVATANGDYRVHLSLPLDGAPPQQTARFLRVWDTLVQVFAGAIPRIGAGAA